MYDNFECFLGQAKYDNVDTADGTYNQSIPSQEFKSENSKAQLSSPIPDPTKFQKHGETRATSAGVRLGG